MTRPSVRIIDPAHGKPPADLIADARLARELAAHLRALEARPSQKSAALRRAAPSHPEATQ